MAYRQYQELLFDLLRKRIARTKKRKERNELRKVHERIHETQIVINKFYTDYPYCTKCGHRAKRGHKHNGN